MEEKFNYVTALEKLSGKYPDNPFYASLIRQYKKRQSLSQKQIACIRKDYIEKFGKNLSSREKPHLKPTFNEIQKETPLTNIYKCKICGAELKSKFDYTKIADVMVCVPCFDKYDLSKKLGGLREKYNSAWWRHVKNSSLKPAYDETQKEKFSTNTNSPVTHPQKEKNKRGSIFEDNRNRSFSELEKAFGKISEYKARSLYERGKISDTEYEKLLERGNAPKTEER